MFQQKLKKFKREKSIISPNWTICLPLAVIIMLVSVSSAAAQGTDGITPEELKVILDTIWVVFAGFLVFFMNAGFAMLETGLCRRKNAANILAKNLLVFAISTVAYWITGFALMFGDGNSVLGTQGFFLNPMANFSSLDSEVPLKAKFFFQLAFAGTAATIVSGAVAERIKFLAFIIFSLLLVGISYPITGHWVWGGGWLQSLGFWDFAGSTVVHSVGGCAALVGVGLLGWRIGKYDENGQPLGIAGHNLSISTLGCLILWLGWFGFNAGSTMKADPDAISHILLTTNMAAATGGIAATITSWLYFSKPDLSMIINGVLAGLVAITGSCRFVNTFSAAVIGAIAGIVVVFSVDFLDRKKIDDPVGAISVHLVCGFWGTIAVGLFSQELEEVYSQGPLEGLFFGGGFKQLLIQIWGFSSVAIFTILFSLVSWLVIGRIFGLRVSKEEEREGLDWSEHGIEAYRGFGK
ncbi:MAG: ammonium transporter [Cyanobacteriota bacterium]|nr:ammonium transporter [Cyanobacteriota bacterium]